MSTEEAMEAYTTLGSAVFGLNNTKKFRPELYKASTLENEIKEIIRKKIVGATGNERMVDEMRYEMGRA